MESILDSVKKQLGIDSEYEYYDADVIVAINMAFSILTQIGVGPKDGFSIDDNTQLWSCYTEDNKILNLVKPYIYGKTRLLFDPPLNSTIVELLKTQCSEYEFRLQIYCDHDEDE